MLNKRNRKIKRTGKVIIPDLLANLPRAYGNGGRPVRRRLFLAVRLGLLILLAYAFLSGPTGFVRLVNLCVEQDNLRAEERVLDTEIINRQTICKALESDTTYLEKIAREEYGFARPGEKIYLELPPPEGK